MNYKTIFHWNQVDLMLIFTVILNTIGCWPTVPFFKDHWIVTRFYQFQYWIFGCVCYMSQTWHYLVTKIYNIKLFYLNTWTKVEISIPSYVEETKVVGCRIVSSLHCISVFYQLHHRIKGLNSFVFASVTKGHKCLWGPLR